MRYEQQVCQIASHKENQLKSIIGADGKLIHRYRCERCASARIETSGLYIGVNDIPNDLQINSKKETNR